MLLLRRRCCRTATGYYPRRGLASSAAASSTTTSSSGGGGGGLVRWAVGDDGVATLTLSHPDKLNALTVGRCFSAPFPFFSLFPPSRC